MKAMKSEQAGQIRRAAIAAGVGAALVLGVVLFVPDKDQRTAGHPEARAMAAVGAGAPASVPDLSALIRDRETWLRGHPSDGRSWAVLGSAYVDRGVRGADSAYYPKAEQALERSLKVRPGARGNAEAMVGLASLANARHDFAAARKWGEAARKQEPKGWTAYPVLIDAYNGLGDYQAAAEALKKFKKLRSGAPVLARSAEVYRDQGRPEDAARLAADATAHAGSPVEKAEARYRQGEFAWERGKPKEALTHYDAALEASRSHVPSLAGRARALAALGRTDEAIRDYQTAIRKLKKPEYLLELGELYDSLGLDGDAQSQYSALRARAARAEADGVNEELVLARFETDHGDPRSAVVRLRAEWARQHRSVAVADALGWALYRAGESREALTYATKATGQGRADALLSYHRGEIERSLEMYGPAGRDLEDALRTNPYFSPLLAPLAREVLAALSQSQAGGSPGLDSEPEPLPPPSAAAQDSSSDDGS
jgi:tetratricopeptide (TPR) repeat protein